MQVVDSQNLQQLVTTGSVPDFVAPTAPQAEPKAEPKTESKPDEPARGADGKFVKADGGAEPQTEGGEKPAATEGVDDGGDDVSNLTEHARKVIGKKHRAQKEAEEWGKQQYLSRRAAEERAEKLQRELQELQTKSRPAPVEAQKTEPKQEDFKTVGEYTDALVEWKFAERERKQAEAQAAAEQNAVLTAHAARIKSASAEIPDFDEVMARGGDLNIPGHVSSFIVNSDVGHKLMYHLAQNPEEAQRIGKLSPIRGIAELGKLEDRLTAKPAAKGASPDAATPPPVSKAPAPITPLASTSSATPTHKDPATMSFKELREYERQREAERARR